MKTNKSVPNISMVISIFNAARWLDNAISSVLQQTYHDFELIIIDDGSTDESIQIVENKGNMDKRIKVIRKNNTGLADSLNQGILAARGEWIARFDADDICLPNRFERQIHFLKNNPGIDILGSNAITIDSAGKQIGTMQRRETHDEMMKYIWTETPFIHPTVMMRKKVWEDTGGYDTTLLRSQDSDLWFRSRHKFRFHNLQEPLIYYRCSEGSNQKFRNALFAGRVIYCAARREKKPLWYMHYAMRPAVALLLNRIQRPLAPNPLEL